MMSGELDDLPPSSPRTRVPRPPKNPRRPSSTSSGASGSTSRWSGPPSAAIGSPSMPDPVGEVFEEDGELVEEAEEEGDTTMMQPSPARAERMLREATSTSARLGGPLSGLPNGSRENLHDGPTQRMASRTRTSSSPGLQASLKDKALPAVPPLDHPVPIPVSRVPGMFADADENLAFHDALDGVGSSTGSLAGPTDPTDPSNKARPLGLEPSPSASPTRSTRSRHGRKLRTPPKDGPPSPTGSEGGPPPRPRRAPPKRPDVLRTVSFTDRPNLPSRGSSLSNTSLDRASLPGSLPSSPTKGGLLDSPPTTPPPSQSRPSSRPRSRVSSIQEDAMPTRIRRPKTAPAKHSLALAAPPPSRQGSSSTFATAPASPPLDTPAGSMLAFEVSSDHGSSSAKDFFEAGRSRPRSSAATLDLHAGRAKKRQRALRELVETEATYAQDLAVARDVYFAKAKGLPVQGYVLPSEDDSNPTSPAMSASASANASAVPSPSASHTFLPLDKKKSFGRPKLSGAGSESTKSKGLRFPLRRLNRAPSHEDVRATVSGAASPVLEPGWTPTSPTKTGRSSDDSATGVDLPWSSNDQKVVFGNLEEVASLAEAFAALLDDAAGPTHDTPPNRHDTVGTCFLEMVSRITLLCVGRAIDAGIRRSLGLRACTPPIVPATMRACSVTRSSARTSSRTWPLAPSSLAAARRHGT